MSLWTEEEKKVYGPYLVNGRQRWADPLAIQDQLSAMLDGDPNQFLASYSSEDAAQRYRARLRVTQAVCAAFGLTPFDPTSGHGATLRDCRALLDDFLDWCQGVKKNTAPSPTSPPPTASAPRGATMKRSSDCGCT